MASVYHPDATDDHGRFKGTGLDFAAYAVSRLTERYEGTMHSITNTVIDFAGPDVAHVESPCPHYPRRSTTHGLDRYPPRLGAA